MIPVNILGIFTLKGPYAVVVTDLDAATMWAMLGLVAIYEPIRKRDMIVMRVLLWIFGVAAVVLLLINVTAIMWELGMK